MSLENSVEVWRLKKTVMVTGAIPRQSDGNILNGFILRASTISNSKKKRTLI
jgi:hypothetical protein